MNEENKEGADVKIEGDEKKAPLKPKMREILIQTDGNSVNLAKAEVSGHIELVGILQCLIGFLTRNQK